MKPMTIVTGRAGQLLPDWLDSVKKAHTEGIRSVSLVPAQYTLQAEL